MEPVATISGLATGIDFRGLVDQIMAAESRPLVQIQNQMDKVSIRSAAWEDFRARIDELRGAASKLSDGTAFRRFTTGVNSPSAVPPFSVSAGLSARPGRFDVEVLQLATREKLGSDYFSSRSDALGVSGEFLLGGQVISVGVDDSLEDIAAQANAAAGGSTGSGVSASVVETTPGVFRLMFTAEEEGASGVNATDGADGVLRALGFMGETVAIKHATSDGALSDAFGTATDPVADLLNFSSVPAAGSVDIGTVSVSLDLSTMSLTDVAEAINSAAGGSSGVRAEVVAETAEDGSTRRRLDISGTTSFLDTGGILESLGVVTGDRTAVAQEVQSNAFTDRNPNRVADAGTRLTRLWLNGSDADVEEGDTLTMTGTRADGSTFSTTYAVGSGDELQDLLDVLNSDVDGFQFGEATATASINEFGQLVVTDDAGGGSLLDLQIVANNEGGGSLDFGEFQVGTTGRHREVVDGVDSRLAVDGNFVTRSSNSVSDVIEGVTLDLFATTEGPVGASVEQDTTQIVEELQAFIDAYNGITEFVGGQFSGAGAAEGTENAPLSGDSTVLQMRNLLRGAMNTLIDPSVGGLRGLFAVGIEVDREGVFTLDEGKLAAALADDPTSVERLFMEHGAGSVATLGLVSANDDVAVGDYLVNVTQAASRAVIDGVGFAGTYSDDANADTLRIVDTGSGGTYDVALSDGMTMDDVVAAINAELGTRLRHQIATDMVFYSDDKAKTVADESTLLADLYDA
ncbi:MAG: flagellar filament capping protein FliD, partial [Gemmatimonadetes bacterium]|nr:flagellar filament capping protein FliD [Gemmatimonadota bacterium]